jgi:CHAT domain-containing protein
MLYDYQILHMATHGHLDNKLPEQSYLLLAGGQDSHLTFGEIGRLEVGQPRLVTLSIIPHFTDFGNYLPFY